MEQSEFDRIVDRVRGSIVQQAHRRAKATRKASPAKRRARKRVKEARKRNR